MACSSIRQVAERIWPEDVPTAVADFKSMSTPFRLLKEVLSERKDELRAQEKNLHDMLTGAGLELNMGKDGSGQFPMFFERFGGLIPVACWADTDLKFAVQDTVTLSLRRSLL
jgi:hypothetical protein